MLIKAIGLTDQQLSDIKALEDTCCRHERLTMKLNWELLKTRPKDESNDFLYYLDNRLVGYIGIYGFGLNPREIELTGMVHPNYRQQGIFKALFNEAKTECSKRGAKRILIITERCSSAGISFSQSTGAVYAFSEYHMQFNETEVPAYDPLGISLRLAEKKDKAFIDEIDKICFGSGDDPDEEGEDSLGDLIKTQYLIEADGRVIGKIGVIMDEGSYVCGFGIKPEYRGKGYGRAALSLTLEMLLRENKMPADLEVEVKNENALGLYKSCGFKVVTIYDYYTLPLN